MGVDSIKQQARRRPRRPRRACASVVVLLALTFSLKARAQGETRASNVVSARLELTLPDDCGSSAWFLERIRVRSDRIRFHPDETALIVQARLSPQPNGLVQAKMTLRRLDGTVATRTIEASNCDQALDGLALVTAVTLDPSSAARTTEATQPEPQAASDKPAPSPSPPLPPPATRAPARRETEEAADTPWTLSLSGVGLRGAAPGWMTGVETAIRVTRARASVLSPSARLGLTYQRHDRISATGGVAAFSLAAATLDACPLRVILGLFHLRHCAVLQLGALTATGSDTVEPESHHRLWSAVGASSDFNVPLGKNWAIPLRALAVFPLTRDTYQFSPAAFFRTPLIAFGASAGLEYRFW